MKKGERRKAEFLGTASRLFSQQGYQGTSIQDILDAVGCSKGSFYHHFESKRQVLEELSDQRTLQSYAAYAAEEQPDGLEKLQRLLYFACPVREGEEGYLASMLSIGEPQENAIMQVHLKESIKRGFYADYLVLMERLKAIDALSYHNPAMPEVLWDSHMAFLFALLDEWSRTSASGGTPPSRAVDLLHAARLQWERMLDLPFGSMTILPAEEMLQALQAAQQQLDPQDLQLRFDKGFAAPCQQLSKPV